MVLFMNWDPMKFDWNKARAFLVTAEEGSFSAAAKALGMSQPTLGRQVTGLEDELGVILIERVNKKINVTPLGLELLEHLKAMGEAASNFALALDGQKDSLSGAVRISCTDTFAVHLLPEMLTKLKREEPNIVIELFSSYEVTNILLRECDIAIRHTPPLDDDLVARKLPSHKVALYHSKQLALNSEMPSEEPITPYVGFLSSDGRYLNELNRWGLEVTDSNFTCKASTHLEHWSMVKAGLGIGMMLDVIADCDPTIVQYHAFMEKVEVPTWLVTHRELRSNRRIKRVYDFLANELTDTFSPK